MLEKNAGKTINAASPSELGKKWVSKATKRTTVCANQRGSKRRKKNNRNKKKMKPTSYKLLKPSQNAHRKPRQSLWKKFDTNQAAAQRQLESWKSHGAPEPLNIQEAGWGRQQSYVTIMTTTTVKHKRLVTHIRIVPQCKELARWNAASNSPIGYP